MALPSSRSLNAASLSIHESAEDPWQVTIAEELLSHHSLSEASLLELTAPESVVDATASQTRRSTSLIFRPVIAPRSHAQVSVSRHMAETFGLRDDSTIEIKSVDETCVHASHVELAFRDQYMTRGDMWHMVQDQLVGKCIYQDQIIEHLGCLKAQIRSIFNAGERVKSAVFGPITRPVFRSESARYVLFLQMSREMWDFDVEGNSEIMLDKALNGFLPELLDRWDRLDTHHLVSIVLFTRMAYYNVARCKPCADAGRSYDDIGNHSPTQDFYRVVVSDLPSNDTEDILLRLRQEVHTFLRDVSIRPFNVDEYVPLTGDISAMSAQQPDSVLSGEPVLARSGNILEAITLASSQFTSDHIDRDLFRTGISVIIVSPGTGIFDVDQGMLQSTTESLSDNGVGIDLVCLSPMPLHSVPLFKYKLDASSEEEYSAESGEVKSLSPQGTGSLGTLRSRNHSYCSAKSRMSIEHAAQNVHTGFRYVVPHWIAVSFWQSSYRSIDPKMRTTWQIPQREKQKEDFEPRIRMYELQMVGVTNSQSKKISLPMMPSLVMSSTVDRQSSMRTNSKSIAIRSEQDWMNKYDSEVFQQQPVSRAITLNKPRIKQSDSSCTSDNISTEAHIPSLRSIQGEAKPSGLSRAFHQTALETPQALEPSAVKSKIVIRPTGLGLESSSDARALTEKTAAQVELSSTIAQEDNNRGRDRLIEVFEAERPKYSRQNPSVPRETGPIHAIRASHNRRSSPEPSGPIQIQQDVMKRIQNERYVPEKQMMANRINVLQNTQPAEVLPSSMRNDSISKQKEALSSSASMSPWVTMLNPCNPSHQLLSAPTRLGRWQHIFPRTFNSSLMKWKSICSPAAVPLTSEGFPTKEQYANEYRSHEYSLSISERMPISHQRSTAVAHMLVFLRLSRGFQIIVGEHVAAATLEPHLRDLHCFDDSFFSNIGDSIYMTRGNAIHHLKRTSRHTFRIVERVRYLGENNRADKKESVYRPMIKSMLSKEYEALTVFTAPSQDALDWESIDNQVTALKRSCDYHYTDFIRPWTIRFVLIPKAPPSSTAVVSDTVGDTAEEINLDGLLSLTRVWQKCASANPDRRTYVPNDDRAHRDLNPLEIQFYTKDPSLVIKEELELVASLRPTNDSDHVELLPDDDRLVRSSLDTRELARRLQSKKGINIADRRWHWRLHHSCFIGLELVNWILQNFQDVESRIDAVNLGKALVADGVIQHVDRRHDFRDGNYFYRLTEPYSIGSNGTASTRSSSFSLQTSLQAAQVQRQGNPGDSDTHTARHRHISQSLSHPRPAVALGRSLNIELNHTKQDAYPKESLMLHHDRIHNPDNCFHMRLDWVSATPMLIQEQILEWSRIIGAHGLRLAQVPIGEASSITSVHPFRAPICIQLSLQPSDYVSALPADYLARLENPTQIFRRAILQHFDFVLDFEAASAFPNQVDVTYSWGKPDYQIPQFVHRSGRLLAQLTHEGNILLLANRLYHPSGFEIEKPANNQEMPQSIGISQRRSSGSMPSSSNISPIKITAGKGANVLRKEHSRRSQSTSEDPEAIARSIEDFCASPDNLAALFADVQSRLISSSPSTPEAKSKYTSAREFS